MPSRRSKNIRSETFVAAGIRWSVSSDDPALLDTDLGRDHKAARSLGLKPKQLYDSALAGVFCEEKTKQRLQNIGRKFDWTTVTN